jgi:hypothetical protein
MKLSNKHLEEFKEEFTKWQEALGLVEYKAYFQLKSTPDAYATISVDEEGKVCMVTLGKDIDKGDADGFNIHEHAKHECCHLLLHRIVWLAQQRYIREGEIGDEWERVTRILERVL